MRGRSILAGALFGASVAFVGPAPNVAAGGCDRFYFLARTPDLPFTMRPMAAASLGDDVWVDGFVEDFYPAEAGWEMLIYHEGALVSSASAFPGNGVNEDGVMHLTFTVAFIDMAGTWRIDATVSHPLGLECSGSVTFEILDDTQGHPFETDVEWLRESEITLGCTDTSFCPDGLVTREQMAGFLVRALDIPVTTTDFFTDDATSIHQDDINRLAASGITTGCTPTRFCPRAVVTRQQMASFLVRGMSLSPTSTDFFTDDERSIHETDINRLAASGITGGCGGTRFCPTQTRGQMAAFLRRAPD